MRYLILFSLLTLSAAIDESIDWQNMQEYDCIPPALKKIFLENKPEAIKEDENRIVGGQIAPANAYPHQVGLALSTPGGQSWCGGSIISEYFVITAAHCLDNVHQASVIIGAHDRENSNEPGRITVRVGRGSFIVHPGWSMQTMLNDIALIRFPTPLTFTNQIRPIALPTRSHALQTFDGFPAIVSGWGRYEVQTLSRYLRYAQSRVVSNSQCKRYFGQMVHSSNICLDGSQARGTCHGDSGGPLMVTTAESGTILAGLTSYGNPQSCMARWPTAFTRVSSHLDWISRNTGIHIRN